MNRYRIRRTLERAPAAALRPALAFAAAGVALAAAVLAADRALGVTLGVVTIEATRLFLSAVIGATITVTALLFWVRGMLVQLAAGQFSPRVLRWYLDDAFLLRSIGFLVGVFAYGSTVLLGMPGGDDGAAPALSTVLAFLLALLALLSIVVAIAHSVHATDISAMLHQVAGETVAQVRAYLPDPQESPYEPEPPPSAVAGAQRVEAEVVAATSGWVTHVEHDRLLERLPPGGALHLSVSAGAFVTEGGRLGTVVVEDAERGMVARLAEELGGSIRVGSRRGSEQDVAFGVRKILDVAVHAVAPGSIDATGAYEATMYLGVVVREILHRQLPATVRHGAEDRVLVLEGQPDHAHYIDESFGRLRESAPPVASVLSSLLATLGTLRSELLALERDARVDALEREAARVLEKVAASDMTDSDRARVQATAREHGLAGLYKAAGVQPSLPW